MSFSGQPEAIGSSSVTLFYLLTKGSLVSNCRSRSSGKEQTVGQARDWA